MSFHTELLESLRRNLNETRRYPELIQVAARPVALDQATGTVEPAQSFAEPLVPPLPRTIRAGSVAAATAEISPAIPKLPHAPTDGSSNHGTNDVLYAMPPGGAPKVVDAAEAQHLNAKGWAIFFTPNTFNGPRKTANVRQLRFWFADLDGGDKKGQLERIHNIPVRPTYVVESRAGYHVYYAISGSLDIETWKRIENRLVELMGADANARDVPRLLRVPGYDNHKAKPPFRVTLIEANNACCTAEEMIAALGVPAKASRVRTPSSSPRIVQVGEAALEALNGCDHQILFERLSGDSVVRGEQYEFVLQPNGNRNLRVNGKSTSFFLNAEGNLRSGHSSCNNIFAWLTWFGHTSDEIVQILRERFADLLAASAAETDLRTAIERLARLSRAEFEIVRDSEADKHKISGSALARMVSARRRDMGSVESDEVSLPWEDTVPASEPVDSAALFDKVFQLIRRFTVCDLPYAYAATLWCGMTWLMNHFRVAPFVMITAPVLGCGKSVMLEVIAQLSYRSLFASSCSEAVLFRVIDRDQVTLLIDESDRAISPQRQELIGTLNASYTRRTARALRCVGEEIEPRSFSTWAAKAFAGIGKLEDTLRSRSIEIAMRRKLPHEKNREHSYEQAQKRCRVRLGEVPACAFRG